MTDKTRVRFMNGIGLGITGKTDRRNNSFFILSLFVATYFIYTDLGVRQVIGYAALCALLILDVWGKSTVRITRTKGIYMFLISVTVVFLTMPDAKHDSDSISYLIAMLILFVYVIFSSYDKNAVRASFSVIGAASVAFMLATLFFSIFPDVYKSYFYPLLSDATRAEADTYMAKGYSIPIAGGYTYANYVFALSFLISLGRLYTLSPEKIRARAGAAVMALIAVAGMVMTGRRSELISLAAAFVIVAFVYRKRSLTVRKLAGILLLPLTVVFIVLLLYFFGRMGFLSRYVVTLEKIFTSGGKGLEALLGGESDITSGRMELWAIAFGLFLGAPIFGIGFFGFKDYIPSAFILEHGDVSNVHNDYLQHLCETGLLGTALWLVPTVWLLYTAFRQAVRIRKVRDKLPPDVVMLNVAALGMQLFFAVLGFLDPCFYARKYWMFYTIAIMCLEFSLQLENTYPEGERSDADASRSSEC